jgi:hypothetical protein
MGGGTSWTRRLAMERVEEDSERRGGTDIELHGRVVATLTIRIADDEAEFDAVVVKASARTVVVEMASGLSTLAVASAPLCELLIRADGVIIRADARPGRRIEDVPDSRQLELVILDEELDLSKLL